MLGVVLGPGPFLVDSHGWRHQWDMNKNTDSENLKFILKYRNEFMNGNTMSYMMIDDD